MATNSVIEINIPSACVPPNWENAKTENPQNKTIEV